MNKNYLISNLWSNNTESQLWIIINCDSYSHAHVYFCTLQSFNLFSFVSCDSIDNENHILWPKWKHISPSAEPNYATAIKSNGEVNGMLYLTAVLHKPPFKTMHANNAQTAFIRQLTSHLRSYECEEIQLLIEFSGSASFTGLHFQRLMAQF